MPGHVHDRPLAGYDDVMAVRAFLSSTYRTTRTGQNWEIRRWEGQFWHDDTDELANTSSARFGRVRLWESPTRRILGLVTPEDGGDAHLQIDPDRRDLEPLMLEWAERHLSELDGDRRTLTTHCLAADEERARLLSQRGYSPQPAASVQRWRSLTIPMPATQPVPQVDVRGVRRGDRADSERLAGSVNVAFGHHFAPQALANFETSPSYDPDLQVVAEQDGELVSHAGVTIDVGSKLAIVEPVCTHPRSSGRGLATAVMAEGLRRAALLGATRSVVGTGLTNTSNHVYAKLGFDEVELVETWQKTWPDRAAS